MMLCLSACDGIIYKDLDPCELMISYKYDYNLLEADAFASQVKRVDLFIFDEKGLSVASPIRVEGDPFEKGFSHPLNLAPGTYTFVAWAGLYDKSYSISNIKDLDAMRVSINNTKQISDKALDHLWHGIVSKVEVKGLPNEHIVIPLIKDTNTFKINLVTTTNQETFDAGAYSIEIVSTNEVMDGYNELVPNRPITYLPYLSEVNSNVDIEGTKYVGLSYELRTGRLFAKNNDKIIIRDMSTNKIVGRPIDMNTYINLYRLSFHQGMPLQEYMDRQDQYVITFMFNFEHPNFDALTIAINGWIIREHSDNL